MLKPVKNLPESRLPAMPQHILVVDDEAAIADLVELYLANEGFTSRAPAEIVQRERDRVHELSDAREKLLALQQRFRDAL